MALKILEKGCHYLLNSVRLRLMNPTDLITISFHCVFFIGSFCIDWSHSKLCTGLPFSECCYSFILVMENLQITEADFSTAKLAYCDEN